MLIGSSNNLQYNTAYYWRVKVKNSMGMWSSGWAQYNDTDNSDDKDGVPATYTFPYTHPSPIPAYTVNPNPAVLETNGKKEVTFTDSSIVYSEEDTRTWNMGDSGKNILGETANPSTLTNPGASFTHIYTQTGSFYTTLKICDDEGCCTAATTVIIKATGTKDLPIWKEISPF